MNDEVLHMEIWRKSVDIRHKNTEYIHCRYIPNLYISALVCVGPTAVPSYLHDSHPAVCSLHSVQHCSIHWLQLAYSCQLSIATHFLCMQECCCSL